jgi:hypothetical protein
MATETIVGALPGRHSRREVQLETVDMVTKGDLEEHPVSDALCRAPDST